MPGKVLQMSGTDTAALRPVYLVTGLVIGLLMTTRSFAARVARPTGAMVSGEDGHRVNAIATGFPSPERLP